MSKLIEKLKELKKLVDLNVRYDWTIPSYCPVQFPTNLTTNFQRNVHLKRNLKPLDRIKNYWAIQQWGGIKTFKNTTANEQLITNFLNACNLGTNLQKSQFNKISSLSKVASFSDPFRFFIYDSRVIFSLNWLHLVYGSPKLWYSQPVGRNTKLNKYSLETILNLSGISVVTIPDEEAYLHYCDYILSHYKQIGYTEPWELEMLLFVIADSEIIEDIKLHTTIALPDITQTERTMITTVSSDEIEPLNEEPVLRELYVEHEVYQSFGSPNQLKRMAKVSETASGITFLAGSNSGKIGGPFFCPEVDIKIISISKQGAVQLKNLLDILSGGHKANQLFKSSDYAAHASHGNSLKIDFTDYSNPSSSFSWEENVMIVKSGFLKQIANLMDGEVQ
jgi:hypothetical protein